MCINCNKSNINQCCELFTSLAQFIKQKVVLTCRNLLSVLKGLKRNIKSISVQININYYYRPPQMLTFNFNLKEYSIILAMTRLLTIVIQYVSIFKKWLNRSINYLKYDVLEKKKPY